MNWDFTVVWQHVGALGTAFYVTAYLTTASILIGTVLGALLAVGSVIHLAWLKWFCKAIVECFLALPVLIIIIWIYYSLPLISSYLVVSGAAASILGLGLSLSAFVAEIVRAGIAVVPVGQLEVALCTGMTRLQALRYILLPQAMRQMWPALMGQYITCYKMSTLASVVAVQELLHTGSTIIAQTYRPLEVYTAIAVIFLVTVWPMNQLSRRLEQTARLGGTAHI